MLWDWLNRQLDFSPTTAPVEWPLWPGDPPGTPDDPEQDSMTDTAHGSGDPRTFEKVGRPSMFVYPSGKPSSPAVVMFAGGSYVHIAIGKGGGDIARRLNQAGMSVFMLKYRLPSGRWAAGPDAVLQDGQRAVRLIRANAARLGIDRARVAALGFSAGGHGAATLAVRGGDNAYPAVDEADAWSAQPDLAGLMFPVIALDRSFAHAVSRDRLLGPHAAPEVAARYSPDLHVTAFAPPTFLAHAVDDTVVPFQNSMAMFTALRAAQVAAEIHLFEKGGHGIKPSEAESRGPSPWPWMKPLLAWCAEHNFVAGS
jgi:acetyl esterase/lipase